MKTTYTNEELQEAIDVAFRESSGDDGFWLGIARAFLDNLPEQTEQEVLSLSQLRPLSEAGPVPEGCVRVQGTMEEGWRYADEPQPEPLVTSPEWTPQAGDVVRLKSGGPLMTVDFTEFDAENNETLVNCLWIKPNGDPAGLKIPTHMLQPSTKEDAR
jgi:uncharacterized protein YodC (DUF2158 family)